MRNTTDGNVPLWRKHAVTAGVAGIAAIFGLAGALMVSGREHGATQAPIINNASGDPSAANLANPGAPAAFYAPAPGARAGGARVLNASAALAPQSSGQSYGPGQQAPAPIVRGNNAQQNESLQYNTQAPAYSGDPNSAGDPNAQGSNGDPNAIDPNAPTFDNQPYADATDQENAGYDALDQAAGADQTLQAEQAPPPLPEYDQPPAPDDNYLWTPGYWSYNSGYYWIPGAWVAPPFYGALWTPPWWGWYRGRYYLHHGYWGPHVGYYGGINYGFGYIGTGYYGGYWQGRSFFYNRSVTNVNITRVHNVYERTVVVNNVTYNGRPMNRVSFNGPNGIQARPRPYELAALREPHYRPVAAQVQLHQAAASNRSQFFSANRGRPAEAFHAAPLSSPDRIASAPPAVVNRSPGGAGFGSRPNPAQPGAAPGTTVGGARNVPVPQRNGQWQSDAGRQAFEQQRNGGQRTELQHDHNVGTQPQSQRQAWGQQHAQQDAQDAQQRSVQAQQQQLQRQQEQQQRLGQQQQQRQVWEQQRNQQVQTQTLEQQRSVAPSVQADQQQRVLQQQQQRQAWEQQRNQQMQQRQQEQQQRSVQQEQQRQAWQQQRGAQPQSQRIEARPAPQPQVIQARPAPQPHMEAPRPAGPQHFGGGGPGGGRHP